MILSALVDLGVDASELSSQLESLSIEPFGLECESCRDSGFAGTRVTVNIHDHDHPHRHLADICGLINASALADPVKALSIKVFELLADAEAAVHGTTRDKIQFHEVGAMDSIVDIVGSCAALHMLGVDGVEVSPLPLGQGTVNCDHGVMPLPVPATAEILKGRATISTDEPYELVTPTGASLLCCWAAEMPVQSGERTIERIGYGFGMRKLKSRPNLLRATLLERKGGTPSGDECLVLECNLDDMVPELVGSLTGKLMQKGALDVFTTPVQMKKQRPGTLLTVLARPADRDTLLDITFTETTTFGVREYITQRTILARRIVDVDTRYGRVRVKVGTWKGRDITRAPEHDDCVACAETAGVPVREVYEEALRSVVV
jgi:uncharacterized protein (TIGR00299 family) protein